MTTRVHSRSFFANRKARRERMLRKLANMRAAKARRRQERIAAGLLEREPKLKRWFPLEFGVRDKATGEMVWMDLRSVRDAARRLGVVLKFYQPGVGNKRQSLRELTPIIANPIRENSR
jgi:hypothetical protein